MEQNSVTKKVIIEFDIDDPEAKRCAQLMLSANELVDVIFKIQQKIRGFSKHDKTDNIIDKFIDELLEDISEVYHIIELSD